MSLAQIKTQIAAAEQAAGRVPGSVTLIAVSKVQPLDRVLTVLEAGQRDALSDATAMIDRRRAELTALLGQLDGFEGDLLAAVENHLVNLGEPDGP